MNERLSVSKKWHSSTHTIADIRDWSHRGALILQPDYQRREVWGTAARIMLIDSIINGIPIPKIFVSSNIKEERTIRYVIDGQQRINAILDFLADEFPLDPPYEGDYLGKKFSELPDTVRDSLILSYEIDFNEAKGLQDAELREVYSRVNKYLVALNRQELRKADFPGDFLNTSEELANLEFFEDAGLFSAAARRRSLDVEFVSELLTALLRGITDRKDELDQCYQGYKQWVKTDREKRVDEFITAIKDIATIFNGDSIAIKKTRWRQKADFFSLFLAIVHLRREGLFLPSEIEPLCEDLKMLNMNIAPTSNVTILSEYAVYCVSQANSASSRKWRTQFLESILRGTYAGTISHPDQRQLIFKIAKDIRYTSNQDFRGDGCPPTNESLCPKCNHIEPGCVLSEAALVWSASEKVFQLSNSKWAHRICCKNVKEYLCLFPSEFGCDDSDDASEE